MTKYVLPFGRIVQYELEFKIHAAGQLNLHTPVLKRSRDFQHVLSFTYAYHEYRTSEKKNEYVQVTAYVPSIT